MERIDHVERTVNSCFYSSFIYVINVLVAYYYGYYFYSNIFAVLFATSVIHHSNCNIYTNLIDKIAICMVVFYGGWLLYDKIATPDNHSNINLLLIVFIITTFLLTVYLYTYGYLCNKFCFYEDKITANYYHSLLHVISSLGHIGIVIL